MKFDKAAILLFIPLLVINLSGLNDFISKQFDLMALLSPIILALVIAMIWLFAAHNRLGILFRREVKMFYIPFGIYLIFGTMASVFESEYPKLIQSLRYYLPSLLIYWVGILGFYTIIKVYGLTKLIVLLRWVFLINTIIIIYSYTTGSELINLTGAEGRYAGFLLNANQAGFSGVMLLVSELYLLAIGESVLSKYLVPIILLGILLTFSRTVFLMTFLVLVLFLVVILNSRNVSQFAKLSVLGALCISVILYFSFIDEFIQKSIDEQSTRIEEFNSFIMGEITPQTTGNRSFLAEQGLVKIQQKPIFGHGLHTFMRFEEFGSGIHNQYLLIWGEAGLVALLAYLWYILKLWNSTDKAARQRNFLVKGYVIGLAFYSATNHNMFGTKFIMLVISLITVIYLDYNYVRDLRIIRKRN